MACNCNEEGKIINIGMGCCVPIVANADAYYTKSEVDEKIEDIVISGGGITSGEVQTMIDESIADKADKSEIPTVPTKVSAFENDVPYLTQHQSLSGYATEQWVIDKHYISGVDLSDYTTKEYVSGFTYDKATIDEKVAGGGTFDPTQYYNKTATDALLANKADTATTYTKTEVNNLLDDKLDASAYTPCDLSNYYTKDETNNQISSATADMATMTWVGQQGYLTEHQSLSGYATEQWVEDQNYITGVDLSNYALKSEIPTVPTNVSDFVNDVPYLTQHQSLSGYATEQWVEDQHYITGVDLSNYALKSEIPTVPTSNTAFTNDAGYLTEHQSLSGYATEQWVEDQNYITGVDLSNYALKSEIPTVPTSNTAFTNDAGYITSSALDDYATSGDVTAATADMATMTWVGEQGFLTEHQSLDNYYTKSETSGATQLSTAFANKADTATTLGGYGITDAYTKSETSGATQLSTEFDTKQDASGMTAYTTTATTDALNTVVINHIDNTTIHVTPNDKDYWNAKVNSVVANSDSSIAYPSTKAVYDEFQMKSVIVYTGNTIVGQSGNIFSNPSWNDLTGVDLSSYKYIKVFLSISKHSVGVSTNNITSPCIVEVHLDNGYAISDINGYYVGGNITTCINNDNRLFGVTVLVNKTVNDVWQIALKTVSLYGTSSTDITNSYIYKIEAYGEDSLESVLTKCVPLTATTTSGTTIIAPNNLEQISGQLTQKTTKQGEMLANSTAITAVNISQCITQIGYQAFASSSSDNGNYSNLAHVEIPSGVIRIETAAFRTIYSDVCHLSTVVCHAEVPPYLGYQVFSTEGNLHIYVPSGCVNAYKEDWVEYADIIYPIA